MALHSLLMNSFGLWYLSNVSFVDWVFMPGTLIVLVLALVLDAIIGDPRWIPHPVKGIGVIIRYFDLTFNRQNFSKNHRKIFGFITKKKIVSNLKLINLDGVKFNPLINDWKISSDKSVNYISNFKKN